LDHARFRVGATRVSVSRYVLVVVVVLLVVVVVVVVVRCGLLTARVLDT